jgi:hypothetical protein
VSYVALVSQDVSGFSIELVGVPVDQLELALVRDAARGGGEAFAKHTLNRLRAVLAGARNAVDRLHDIFRECDRCLYFHTTIILRSPEPKTLVSRHAIVLKGGALQLSLIANGSGC